MTRIAAAVSQQPQDAPRKGVGIGHNRPPMDVEARAAFDEAIDQRPGLRKRMADLLQSADRARATTAEEAGRCGELVKQLRAVIKVIDDAHSVAKEPYLAAGRAVDAAKNELRAPLDAAKRTVEAKQTAFLNEEQQRREREAAEARRREEEARRAQQASAAADEPITPPPPSEPERTVIRGDFGATVSSRKERCCEVEDYELAFIAVADNSKVREAIDKAVKALVRAGVTNISGVRIWTEIKASNR